MALLTGVMHQHEIPGARMGPSARLTGIRETFSHGWHVDGYHSMNVFNTHSPSEQYQGVVQRDKMPDVDYILPLLKA
jgi:hypothetical protein